MTRRLLHHHPRRMDRQPGATPRHAAPNRARTRARPLVVASDRARHVVGATGSAGSTRTARAQGWAGAVLALASVAFVASIGRVGGAGPTPSLDVETVDRLATLLLPALLVGWCTGFAAVAVLLRIERLDPRVVGVLAALVGVGLAGLLGPVRAVI